MLPRTIQTSEQKGSNGFNGLHRGLAIAALVHQMRTLVAADRHLASVHRCRCRRFSETAGSVQDDRAEKPVAIMEFEMSHPSAEDALETGKREVTSALSNAHG